MSFAHIQEIKEVSDFIEANRLIATGHELLQIVPGWTSDNTPCTLFYLGKANTKPTLAPSPIGVSVSRRR